MKVSSTSYSWLLSKFRFLRWTKIFHILSLTLVIMGFIFLLLDLNDKAVYALESTYYDFIAQASNASWRSGAGDLDFPGEENDEQGFALIRENWRLEDDSSEKKVLESHPEWVSEGWIEGKYPALTIPTNAQLKIKVGFLKGATGSDGVNFQVHFEQGGNRQTLITQFAAYDGILDEKIVNLANFAGRSGQFILETKAGKSAGQDWAVWVEARITSESAQAQPDLVVDDILLQDSNYLEIIVKNIGPGSLISGWSGTGEVSIDGKTAGTFDLRKAQSVTGGGIGVPGGSSSYQFPWKINTPALISCSIDSTNNIEESNENNNFKEEEVSPSSSSCASGCDCLTLDEAKEGGYSRYCQDVETICGYSEDDTPKYCWIMSVPVPDLLVRFAHLNILGDNRYEIEYLIANWGLGPAANSISGLYVDDVLVSEAPVLEMASAEERYETFTWQYDLDACTLPNDIIRIVADQPDRIDESFEDNNAYTLTITCDEPPPEALPDLLIRRVWTEDLGGGENLIGIEIENFSMASADPTQLGFFIDGVLIEELSVPALDPLEIVELAFSTHYIIEDCTSERDTLVFEVDLENTIIESNEANNKDMLEWSCVGSPLADLIINNVWWEYDPATYEYILNYSIQNQSLTPADPSATKIWINEELIGTSSVPAMDGSEIIAMIAFRERWNPTVGENEVHICADANDTVEESRAGEMNNCLAADWSLPDLAVKRIWLENINVLCYEVENQGGAASPSTTSEVYIRGTRTCPADLGRYMSPSLPEIPPGESEIICINLEIPTNTYSNGCNRWILYARVEADRVNNFSLPPTDDILSDSFSNLCADGIQNQGEEGIDCGGPCPAQCQDCWAREAIGSAEDAGYFSLYSPRVFSTARVALMEYANCLRDFSCRSTLMFYDTSLDFSSVTADLLAGNTDYIMEAVAYYVDKHTSYMFDDDRCERSEICDSHGVINAEDMIMNGDRRIGYLHGVPCPHDPTSLCDYFGYCDNTYCGDCEDHAILREALMRLLGISHTCAYVADHWDGYWGDSEFGHSFNLVFYRSKWRIMDYGSLGSKFYHSSYKIWYIPRNIWNDHEGELWCPEWMSDPACLICCPTDPYLRTQNYAEGPECNPINTSNYYIDCTP